MVKTSKKPKSLWQKKKGTMILIVALFLVMGTVFTFVQEFRYESRSRLLLIQNFPAGTDPYNASKSNEFLANVLAQVVRTNSFYQEVMNAGFNINQSYFGTAIDEQVREWARTVRTDVVNDTGFIEVYVYHPERTQADQISRAINAVLKTKHREYHGMGDDIELKIVDQPLTSVRPAKPNVVLNLGLSLLFGIAVALMYVYLFPEEGFGVRLTDGVYGEKGADEEDEKEIEYTEAKDGVRELEPPQPDPAAAREHLSHRQVEYYQRMGAVSSDNRLESVMEPEDEDSLYTHENEMKEMSLAELKKRADMRNVLKR